MMSDFSFLKLYLIPFFVKDFEIDFLNDNLFAFDKIRTRLHRRIIYLIGDLPMIIRFTIIFCTVRKIII